MTDAPTDLACKRLPRDATPHRNKMTRKKARPRVVLTAMVGVPASINRHTGKPHLHRNGAL